MSTNDKVRNTYRRNVTLRWGSGGFEGGFGSNKKFGDSEEGAVMVLNEEGKRGVNE